MDICSNIYYMPNPFRPVAKPIIFSRPLSVRQLVDQNGIKYRHRRTVCVEVMPDGTQRGVLRKEWDTFIITDNTHIVLMDMPADLGGGGSNPLRFVLMIALSVIAGPLAAGLPGASTALFTIGAEAFTLGSLYKMGIMMLGGMLINALVPPPKPPSNTLQSLPAPSPTYSTVPSGNQGRLGQPIPVVYGYHKIVPDYAADPYWEFLNNDQYLYLLFMIGQGEYDVYLATGKFGDTLITSLGQIQSEIIIPGAVPTLFPANVNASSAVQGIDLIYNTWTGAYIANEPNTDIDRISFDIVAPRGLYTVDKYTGAIQNATISFDIQYQEIDDNDIAIGVWTTAPSITDSDGNAASKSITASTTTPIRRSYFFDVPLARYQVRMQRTNADSTDTSTADDLTWGGLRSYYPNTNNFGGVTMLALKVKATNNVGQNALRDFSIEVQRKIPIWSTAGGWTVPQATSSIAWALADTLKASYGAELSDSEINLTQLETLDATWTSRSDRFDGVFADTTTMWEAITSIARAGRAIPYQQGGIINFVRDEPRTIPTAFFSMRNIAKGTFALEYAMFSEQSADSVTVKYWDNRYWKELSITCTLLGDTSNNPAVVKLFGVTDRNQAYREGMYMAAANKYRRQTITLRTELEGLIPTYGDLLRISHSMPGWGVSGDIISYDSGTNTLVLSQDVTFGTGNYYIAMRKSDGTESGPYLVIAGSTADEVILQEPLEVGFTPYTGGDKERTHFAFGIDNEYGKLCLLRTMEPQIGNTVSITAINEDDRVHTAELQSPPTETPPSELPTRVEGPDIVDIDVSVGVKHSTPSVSVAITAGAGADRYIIQSSIDGQNWTTVYEGESATAAFYATPGPSFVRASAIGLVKGSWSSAVAIDVPDPNRNIASLYYVKSKVVTDPTRAWEFPVGFPTTNTYPEFPANPGPDTTIYEVTERIHEEGLINQYGFVYTRPNKYDWQHPYEGDATYEPVYTLVKGTSPDSVYDTAFTEVDWAIIEADLASKYPGLII